MIADVPRPRPPHLHREVTRHGRVTWYVRLDKGPRIRLRAPYGTPEFQAAYEASLAGKAPSAAAAFSAKTLGWLIERYRDSGAWKDKLSLATRKQRERILRNIAEREGRESIARITKAVIQAGVDRRTAAAGKHFLLTMRGMFEWAVKAQHANNDPTAGVNAQSLRTEGHHTWTEDECLAYEARWPRGTRERVAFDVLLYTGLRAGDAVKLGRPHVKRGVATIRTEKTGQIVTLPILPPLQETLDAGPIGEMTFIASEAGRPRAKKAFGNWFRAACNEAGVPGSAHGLRKAAATRAANNGATEAQLEALFGWRGGQMAALYTREANRIKLSLASADALLSEQDANLYSLTSNKVRAAEEKS